MGSTRKAPMSRTVVGVPVNQHGLRALWIGPYFIVEKIQWNENGMVRMWRADVRSISDSKRSARESGQGTLVEGLCDDYHCKYWFNEYISGK